MPSKGSVLVIEDEDGQRVNLVKAMRDSDRALKGWTVGPDEWPTAASSENWLKEQITTNRPSTLLDLELSRLPGRLHSETFLELIFNEGAFCLVYTSRRDGRKFEYQGRAVTGERFVVISKEEEFGDIAKTAWNLIRDFESLSADLAELDEPWTRPKVVAVALNVSLEAARTLVETKNSPVATLSKAIEDAALSPTKSPERDAARRRSTTDVAYWLNNVGTFFPGVLVDDAALASYLGIPKDSLTSVAHLLKEHEFAGRFAHGKRYWLTPRLVSAFGKPGKKSAEAFHAWLAKSKGPKLEVRTAGYYCPLTRSPISEADAKPFPEAPSDAFLTRTTALQVARMTITAKRGA